jgi:hypothetical protein
MLLNGKIHLNPKKSFRTLYILILTSLLLSNHSAKVLYAESGITASFSSDLELLFTKLEACQCTFIRNGSEHSPKEAIEHMRLKLKNSGGRIQTIPNFIQYIATKSSLTGSIYKIRFKNREEIEAAPWLIERAKEMNIYR